MALKVIRADRLLDGRGAMPEPRPLLLINDGQIVSFELGVPADAPLPAGAEVLYDGPGTLLPGLIDAHVHLTYDWLAPDDPPAVVGARAAERALRAGITTVRDCGGPGEAAHRLREAVDRGELAGPHMLVCGRPLTVPGGHCWHMGAEAADQAALLRLIDEECERGADFIKIMATGGNLTATTDPSRPQFDLDTLRAAIQHAHERGRPVACHAHGAAGIALAAQAGADTIEHASFFKAPGEFDFDERAVEAMKQAQCAVVPTLGITLTAVEEGRRPPEIWEKRREIVRKLMLANLRVVAGSDAGIPNAPHDHLLHELRAYVACGLRPSATIAAATGRAAWALGLPDQVGLIAPGQRADLLVVAGDASADITALQRPLCVVKAGTRV